jgi:carboxyvinyl-carboxyphosphonate phosphorylmutase
MSETGAARLRALLAGPAIIQAPGAYDGLSAKLIARAGFPAVYLTGAGVSYTQLGRPDVGLLTASEMALQAERVAEAVDLPVLADMDTGYGNFLNVQRAVRDYERAGVAGFHIEDQVMPKRCGHLAGKELVSVEEMVGKLKAALDARSDPDTVVIARTDARTVEGFEAALERAHRYVEAGADAIFLESPLNDEELRRAAAELRAPGLANMVEGGRTPLHSAAELETMGFRIVIWPNALTRFVARAAGDFLASLREHGSTDAYLDRMLAFADLQALLGLDDVRALEARYRPAAEPIAAP